jgi:hypothetical protein
MELQIARLGEVLRAVGSQPLLQAPLVVPSDHWFPDRWTPDLESVRRILFRLAEYAGMPELGIEVVLGSDWLAKAHLPQDLHEAFDGAQRSPSHFLGFHTDVAWFTIDRHLLAMPRSLVAVMAHEVARAWRARRGLPTDHAAWKAGNVSATAVLLGFGVLLCNDAYEYTSAGHQYGLLAVTRWDHVNRGPLPVEDVARLLACWAGVKNLPTEELLGHLQPTQAQEFRKGWEELAEVDLWARFGLTGDSASIVPVADGATSREFPAGYASKAVHACVAEVVAVTGEEGGLVPEPVRFGVTPVSLQHRPLARWARVTAVGDWWRSLTLVNDPEWDTQVFVVEVVEHARYSAFALGHIRDRDARNHHRLPEVTVELFDRPGLVQETLVPELPTVVVWPEGQNSLSDGDMKAIFRAATSHAAPAQLALETTWLRRFSNQTRRRIEAERAGGGIPPAPPDQIAGYEDWWGIVSDRSHVKEQWSTWAQMSGWPEGAARDSGAQSEQTATIVLPFNA